MLKKALKDICNISNDPSINVTNYLNAIDYIDNLYKTVSIVKQSISIKKINFQPTFKSKLLCEQLGICATPEENELRLIKITSDIFREDKTTTNELIEKLKPLCTEVTLIDNLLIIKIK